MSEYWTCSSLAKAAGISRDTACRRLKKYRAGLISREALLAPPQLAGVGRNPTPDKAVIDAIVAATGITRAGALNRLRLAEVGDLHRDMLYASRREILAWRVAQRRAEDRRVARQAPTKAGNWGNLGLGPRKRTQDIPGGTAWERTHLGR